MSKKTPRKDLALTEGELIDMEGKGRGTIKRAKRISSTVTLVAIAFPSGPLAGYIGEVVSIERQDESPT